MASKQYAEFSLDPVGGSVGADPALATTGHETNLSVRTARPALAQPSDGSGRRKLASRTADRILQDVVSCGWPVGEVLGSEAELLERYKVSRAVFREAVRIVEHQQVARMRRGPGGGLVVDAPSASAVIDAVVVYLFYADARLDEVFEARTVLEEATTEFATSRLTDQGVATLRQVAEEEAGGTAEDTRRLHVLLASLSANPVLELFIEILNRVAFLYFSDRSAVKPSVRREAGDAHVHIIDAVLAGNSGLARHRMRSHLDAEAAFIREHRMSRQALDPDDAAAVSDGVKRAERISRSLFREVVALGWPVGRSLGSEADLMERFDASRAVFREAVRLLEHDQIAVMRRGRGGGLFVVAPGIGTIADAAAICLEQRGIEASHLAEMRMLVELAVIDFAAERVNSASAQRLFEALNAEVASEGDGEFSDAAHDLHVELSDVAENQVLALIVRVLARLTKLHQTSARQGPDRVSEMPEAVLRAHRAIVEAVVAQDAPLARHRQRRHLAALASWLR